MLTGLGWLLASTAASVQVLYVLYGVIGGVGVGIAYGVPVAVSTRWFPDRRGLAVGLTVLGFGFSAFVTANLAGMLIRRRRGDGDLLDLRRVFMPASSPCAPPTLVSHRRVAAVRLTPRAVAVSG